MSEKHLVLVLDSLGKARSYYQEKNYGRAFAHYLVVFQLLEPSARQEYEKEFTTVLHLWGSILHQREQYNDVFRCYHMALSYFPKSYEILNNQGVHSLKLKRYSDAKEYFENSLAINPEFLPAEQNLLSTKYALVERWHFPMLNDLTRNKSYAQAIFMEISHGFTNILDVGMGTGILSLFASKSKQCKSITACDYSDTMFEIATKVLQANNVTNVKLVKKMSSNLVIPDDLSKRVSLLVTEILDCGVFGECILETMIHAWEHLLQPYPYGRVIPAGVTLYVTGFHSPQLAARHRLLPHCTDVLNLNRVSVSCKSELYDSENLRMSRVKYMTDTKSALTVDFNNIVQLKILMSTAEYNPDVSLECTASGEIDGFAVWFKLQLNDTISLSNCPESAEASCWEQAVVVLTTPLPVIQSNTVDIKLSCVEGFLELFCKSAPTGKAVHHVSKKVVAFLNDELLMTTLQNAATNLSECYRNKPRCTVLDISPFPVLGLLLAQKGAFLTCRAKDLSFEALVRHVCRLNKIDEASVTFVSAKDFNDYTSSEVEFDVIFQNLIGPSGLLSESELYQVEVMRYSLSPLGTYLPHSLCVWMQLVQCPWLDRATRVHDTNVCGFKIARFINEYRSSEQRYLDLEAVEHVSLSAPIKLGLVKYDVLNPYVSKAQVVAVADGLANAAFYWFEFELLEGMSISTRRAGCYVSNAAFVFDRPVAVSKDQPITLALKQHNGILKIYISEPD